MDHVIDSLKVFLEAYEDYPDETRDEKAVECIRNAMKELYKYYK